jgi:hypothetical protein
MGEASGFLGASRAALESHNEQLAAEVRSTLGRELWISGDVPTAIYTVSNVAVGQDGMVELRVVRKDAQDGRPSNSFR